jgi:hypothetical protein
LNARRVRPERGLDVDGGPWPSLTARADSNGDLALTTQVSATAGGQYTAVLTGRSTGFTASAGFRVSAVTLSPTSGGLTQSTAIRVSGVGYTPGQAIDITSKIHLGCWWQHHLGRSGAFSVMLIRPRVRPVVSTSCSPRIRVGLSALGCSRLVV